MTEKATAEKKTNVPFYKKAWFWVVVIIVVICVGAAGASNNKEPEKVNENGDSSEQQDSGDKIFKVGDTIAIDNQKMTITGVERNWSAEYAKPKDGKEYIRVKISLENESDDKLSYFNTYWKIEDPDGAIDDNTIVIGNDDGLDYGEIAAGGKKTGSLIFEVPKDATNLKIHYQPDMWTDREAIIEL